MDLTFAPSLKKKLFYFRGEKLSQMTLNKKIIFLNVLKFIKLQKKTKKTIEMGNRYRYVIKEQK